MNKARGFIERFYRFLRDYWIASVLFYIVPTIIISTIKLFGKPLGLIDPSGTLTNPGNVLTMLALGFVVLYSTIKEYADKNFNRANKDGQQILDRVLSGINDAKKRKRDRFVKYIEDYHENPPANPFPLITQPTEQIEEVLKEIQKTFVDIFGVAGNQVGMSLVCKLNGEPEWIVVARVNVGHAEHIAKLITNPNSAFYPVANDQIQSVFIPRKAAELLKGRYVAGERDFTTENIGSIICMGIDISRNKHYVRGILSISTYDTELYEDGDLAAERKIKERILPPFITRLEIELALLFIKSRMFHPSP